MVSFSEDMKDGKCIFGKRSLKLFASATLNDLQSKDEGNTT